MINIKLTDLCLQAAGCRLQGTGSVGVGDELSLATCSL